MNLMTIPDSYSLPNINEIFSSLGAIIFSTLNFFFFFGISSSTLILIRHKLLYQNIKKIYSKNLISKIFIISKI